MKHVIRKLGVAIERKQAERVRRAELDQVRRDLRVNLPSSIRLGAPKKEGHIEDAVENEVLAKAESAQEGSTSTSESPLPQTTDEAIMLLEKFRLEHPRAWAAWVIPDRVSIEKSRVRELRSGWWIPLGAATKRYLDYRGDEAFAVVTRDGSSNGWYESGKPIRWDDFPRVSWHRAVLNWVVGSE
jgi:hypothetical protein